ncbi:MAG: cyclic nucleotide-binding domain-containing protein [Candidatus Xenobia bacterium]
MKPVQIPEQELLTIPFFKGIGRKLKRFIEEKDLVALQFEPGEIICREGEYAYTCYYILEGTAQAAILNPVSREHTTEHMHKQHGGFKINFGFKKKTAEKPAGDHTNIVPIDIDHAISYESLSVELGEGDLIGEATTLNRYPRSTTVIAKTAVIALEFTGWVLRQIKETEEAIEHMNEKYLKGSFQSHIRSVALFSDLNKEEMDFLVGALTERVEFHNYNPGDQIIAEGTLADAFYMIRGGHVKVAMKRGVGEVALAYLGRGSYFGETAIVSGKPRGASVYALDHVEAVNIKAEDFSKMLKKFPSVHDKIVADMKKRAASSVQMTTNLANLWYIEEAARGTIMEGEDLLVIDLERCTRCDNCVAACATIHDGQTRLIRKGQKLGNYLIPTSCRQCTDPLCMIGCPVSAVVREPDSGEVQINDRCIGCGHCAHQCPYGNIIMVTLQGKAAEHVPAPAAVASAQPGIDAHGLRVRDVEIKTDMTKARRKATKCDLCKGLPYAGCVHNCPHGAALRLRSSDFIKDLEHRYAYSAGD